MLFFLFDLVPPLSFPSAPRSSFQLRITVTSFYRAPSLQPVGAKTAGQFLLLFNVSQSCAACLFVVTPPPHLPPVRKPPAAAGREHPSGKHLIIPSCCRLTCKPVPPRQPSGTPCSAIADDRICPQSSLRPQCFPRCLLFHTAAYFPRPIK